MRVLARRDHQRRLGHDRHQDSGAAAVHVASCPTPAPTSSYRTPRSSERGERTRNPLVCRRTPAPSPRAGSPTSPRRYAWTCSSNARRGATGPACSNAAAIRASTACAIRSKMARNSSFLPPKWLIDAADAGPGPGHHVGHRRGGETARAERIGGRVQDVPLGVIGFGPAPGARVGSTAAGHD